MFWLDYFRLRRVMHRNQREALAAINELKEEMTSIRVLLQIIRVKLGKLEE